MRETSILFKTSFKRSRGILLLTLVVGLVLCLIYNGMASLIGGGYEGVPIGFYPHEETAITQDLREYLTDELGMQVNEATDMDYLNTELIERHIAGIIELPEGFEAAMLNGSPIPLEVSFTDDYANSAFTQSYLQNYTASLATLALAANGNPAALATSMAELENAMPSVTTRASDNTIIVAETQKNSFRQVIGFYLMFAFFAGFALSNYLFDDRKQGIYNRMRATSLRTVQYLVGTCSIGMLSSVLLIAPFFVYMAILQPNIVINLWQAVAFCLVYSLFVIAVSIAASLYVNSRNALMAALIGTATITCMMGGAYFPIETSPVFMQQLAKITPQYWFMQAIYSLQANPSSPWLLNLVVVLLFAILFFIIAGIRFVHSGKMKRAA